MIHHDFPGVEDISAAALEARLDESDTALVLVDVREEPEYAVSHLPGALRVEPGGEIPPFLETLDKDTPIVAYCSVGYRSSRLVARLEKEGFTNVKNLDGSIFEWANEGYPVVRDGREVHDVHPYDEKWGTLLAEKLRAYSPRE